MCTLFILSLLIATANSRIHRVDSESDGGNGTSWDTACNDLTSSLERAVSGDSIWLKGNRTYLPTTLLRDSCFSVPFNVSIYGGFKGDEISIDQRPTTEAEKANYESIISGNIGNINQIDDNCYHVITYNEELQLDRVTVSDGTAIWNFYSFDDRRTFNGYGAAMIASIRARCFDSDAIDQRVVINEVIFRSNVALNGGALFFGGSASKTTNVLITKSLFENNAAADGLSKCLRFQFVPC